MTETQVWYNGYSYLGWGERRAVTPDEFAGDIILDSVDRTRNAINEKAKLKNHVIDWETEFVGFDGEIRAGHVTYAVEIMAFPRKATE